jgi:hypothetical protein
MWNSIDVLQMALLKTGSLTLRHYGIAALVRISGPSSGPTLVTNHSRRQFAGAMRPTTSRIQGAGQLYVPCAIRG